ncbi:hypothetical protein B0H10DRAFT_1967175 [Mycena sp. CBHHK59/15]|nr:hypothetical protein B0H10DRAFT_1967175 [Mycena sp. CBHHK59/15]
MPSAYLRDRIENREGKRKRTTSLVVAGGIPWLKNGRNHWISIEKLHTGARGIVAGCKTDMKQEGAQQTHPSFVRNSRWRELDHETFEGQGLGEDSIEKRADNANTSLVALIKLRRGFDYSGVVRGSVKRPPVPPVPPLAALGGVDLPPLKW